MTNCTSQSLNSRLSMFQTAARKSLVIFAILGTPLAQAQPAPAQPAQPQMIVVGGSQTDRCEYALRRFDDANKQIRGCTSANCLKRVVACTEGEESIGAASLAAGAFDPTGCAQTLSSSACPERGAGTVSDFRTQLKDAESRLRDARRDNLDAQKEMTETQKDFRKSITDLQKRARDGEKEIRDRQQQATDDLKKAMQELDASKMKALEDSRKKYDEIDVEYIKMRDKVRRDVSKVADLKIKHQVDCRNEAERKYRESEALLLKRLQEENSITKNQSFSSAAGYYNRQKRKKRKELSMNYTGFFNDCLAGTSPAGSAALAAIASIEREKADNEKQMIDMAARLEKLRLEQIDRLKQIEQMVEEQKQALVKQVEQRMQNLQQDYQRAMQENMQEYQNAVQDFQSRMGLAQSRLQNAGQELNSANLERMTSHTRVQCAQTSGGSISSSSGDRRLQNYEEIRAAIPAARAACVALRTSGCIGAPDKCDLYDQANTNLNEELLRRNEEREEAAR
jgi:hypothetical protein